MAAGRVTMYFDFACPFAYIASERMAQVPTTFVPVLLPGLYAASDAPQGTASASTVMSAAKLAVVAADLRREAARHGVALVFNSRHPVRTVSALRAVSMVAAGPLRAAAVHAVYRAYWVDDADVSDIGVLAAVLAPVVPSLDVAAAVASAEAKDALRAATDALAARGAFGVPCFDMPDGSFVWGGQFIPLVAAAVLGSAWKRVLAPAYAPLPAAIAATTAAPPITFYFDVGSPFSALAHWVLPRVAASCGARIDARPVYLGALLAGVGTDPMATSAAKKAFLLRSLDVWAAWWEVPFAWSPHFPLAALAADRVALAHPETTDALFTAAWVDGRDVGDRAVLADVVGANAARAADDPAVKAALRANTEEAIAAGVCGVPAFVVDGQVVWGQDRVDVVAELVRAGRRPRL